MGRTNIVMLYEDDDDIVYVTHGSLSLMQHGL